MRAVFHHQQGMRVELRESHLGPTPYLVLLWRDKTQSAIRTVTIGPTPHPNEAYVGIHDLLKNHELHDKVEIRVSDTPLRWPLAPAMPTIR